MRAREARLRWHLPGASAACRGAINIMFLHISVVETRLLTAYGT